MIGRQAQIDRLREALGEVRNNKQLFSANTYTQVVLALLDRIRRLQTLPEKSSRPEPDEIRLVTVMFADIKDSTVIARQLDTGDWKDVLGKTHGRIAAVVAESGGEVGQYLGDGVLCFFGAHRSRGDDAVRAVSCALAIQQAVGEYAEEIARDYGVEFALRIGISTGRVVVGMIGAGKQEFLALGTSTNLASRLQTLCTPGGILIDAPTYHRIRNNFVTQSCAPAKLKGFDQPVEHYAVLSRRQHLAARLTRTSISGIEIPFVGRSDELAQIKQIWEQALEDEQFHVVTISGEIGLGKSRLLQETVARSADKPFSRLSMVADYGMRNTSYNLLRNLLATGCNLTDETTPVVAEEHITRFVAETGAVQKVEAIAAVTGYLAGYGFADSPHVKSLKKGGAGQERMAFALLAEWLCELAESSSLLITVDNLQWADIASLKLLEYLVIHLAGESGVLMATARTEFHSQHPNYMQSCERHFQFALGPLDDEAASSLINAVLLHVDNVPPALASLISERAEGNPLFIEEFLDMLFDNGVFEPVEEGRWKINRYLYNTTISTLPDGLLDILQARLDVLSSHARHIAQNAAVVGQTFWASAVAQICDTDVQEALDEMVTRGIIIHSPESSFEGEEQYHFRHTSYREVAYEMLTRTAREDAHLQAAQWLQHRVADKSEYLATLAEHFVQGQRHEQALSTYLTAVNSLLERGLINETLKLIEKGLAIARNVPRSVALPVVSSLWVAQGRALNALNRYGEASAASQSAQRLLGELPPDEMVTERILAARMLGRAFRCMGRYTESLEALQQAYEFLSEDDPARQASVLRSFGVLYYYQGQLEKSLVYQQRAYNCAQEAGNERQISGVMTQLGLILLDRGNLTTALDYFERVLELNRKRGNIYYQILDLINIGMVYRAIFAYELALEVLDEANTLQSSIHFYDALLQSNRALCWISLGRVEEGLSLLRDAAAEPQQNIHNHHLAQLALISGLARTGDYINCVEQAKVFVEAVRDTNPILYGRGLLWLGMAGQALGDHQANHWLEEALEKELTYGGRDLWLCYHVLGLTSDNPVVARSHYEKAAHILRAVSTSLHSYTDLQIILLNSDLVQMIFASAEQPEEVK